MLYGIFDGAENMLVDDVACVADDEQISKFLVEDDLGRHAAVRAAEHHGEGMLTFTQGFAVFSVCVFRQEVPRYETFVACFEGLEGSIEVFIHGLGLEMQR